MNTRTTNYFSVEFTNEEDSDCQRVYEHINFIPTPVNNKICHISQHTIFGCETTIVQGQCVFSSTTTDVVKKYLPKSFCLQV